MGMKYVKDGNVEMTRCIKLHIKLHMLPSYDAWIEELSRQETTKEKNLGMF